MAPTERTPSSSCGDVLSDSFNVGRFAWDVCAATSDAAEQLEWKQPGTAEEKDALQPGDHVIALGNKLVWSEAHQRPCELQKLRQEGDPLADAALEEVLGGAHGRSGKGGCPVPPRSALLEAVEAHGGPACAALLADAGALPDWVDWGKVAAGQTFLLARLPACMASLLYVSLVGGFGAPLIAQVLSCTGYIGGRGKDATWRRLLETAMFVCDVVDPHPGPEAAWAPRTGRSWRAAMRVRLMHAAVRRQLQSRGWDSATYGVPINQQDIRLTGLAFSMLVLLGLERLGVPMDDAEVASYLHLWRLVSHVLGLLPRHSKGHLDSAAAALACLQSSALHLMTPSALSHEIVANTLAATANRPPAFRSWAETAAVVRALQGDALSDKLNIPLATAEDKLAAVVPVRSRTRVTLALASLPLVGRWVVRALAWAFRAGLTAQLGEPRPSYHVGADHVLRVPGGKHPGQGAAPTATGAKEERDETAGGRGLASLVPTDAGRHKALS